MAYVLPEASASAGCAPALPDWDRRDRLPPDIDYCLDNEQEIGGIGCDDRAYVDLFDDDAETWFPPLTRGGAGAFAGIVRERHLAWRAAAPIGDRLAVDWAGLVGLRWAFQEAGQNLGYEIVYRLGAGVLPDREPVAVLCAMDLSREAALEDFLGRARPVVARSLADAEEGGAEAFLAARGAPDRLYAAASERIRARGRRLFDLAADPADLRPRTAPSAGLLAAVPPPDRRGRKASRKALSRSFHLLTSVLGRETARGVLDGDAVTVEGRRFDFRMRVANLRSTSHGAIEVSVTDKDCVELASLCVYLDQTPALDQMAGLVLNVVAGNEDELLKRANVIRTTEAGASHEGLRASVRAAPAPMIPALCGPVVEGAERGEFTAVLARRMAEVVDREVWEPMRRLTGLSWQAFFAGGARAVPSGREQDPLDDAGAALAPGAGRR